jgi:hypothetical protein
MRDKSTAYYPLSWSHGKRRLVGISPARTGRAGLADPGFDLFSEEKVGPIYTPPGGFKQAPQPLAGADKF